MPEFEFEFDPEKSEANLAKHGIDFVQAQELWHGGETEEAPAPHPTETRHMVIGMIAGKHWTALVTYREHRIRIISVRRSRWKEVAIYEDHRRYRSP